MDMDIDIDVKKYLQNCSNKLFLIDERTNISETYETFYKSSCSVGGFLLEQGLKTEDRIVIMMDNSVMLAKIYFACLYAGIVVVPVNPLWNEEQISFILHHSQARLILTTPNYQKKIKSNLKQLIFSDTLKDSHEEDVYSFKEIETQGYLFPNDYLKSSNIAIIIYTSGTTSQPKGVIHTVADLVGNGLLFKDTMQINEKNRFFNMLPMTYLGGYYNLLLIPYLAQSSVILSSAFSPQTMLHFWESIIKYQVNTLWLVPTIMALLMEFDRNSTASNYSKQNIILTLVGTAPLSHQLKKSFESKYGIKVRENYGLSETLFISSELPQQETKGVGKILPTIVVKILNKQDEELPLGEEGEIVVTSPYIMQRYLGLENEFERNKDLSFRTGDLGFVDNENNLFITGRKKDLIIKGGINISPAAVEEIIYQHPEIHECAVVGIPHPLSGEEIIAVVTTKDEINFSELKKAIISSCQKQLTSIQVPSDVVKIDELPHTFTGKIQKGKLRNWLVEHKNLTKKKTIKKVDFFRPSSSVENTIPALSIAYNNMVYDLQSKNIDVTVLSLGEAFFDLPLLDFNKLPFPASYHYSHSRGIPKLRSVLSNYFQDQYDVKFNPDTEIVLTAGSKIAIYMTLMALINPGDEVLIHDPSWVSYPEQVKLCHGIPVCIPYNESVFDFEKYITNRTKVLIINNPNNPKGSILTLDEIAHLYKLAEKYHLYILSDEAYSDFVVNKEQFISIGNFDKNFQFSVICNSISKNFGISGWRIGYVISNPALINQILKLNQHLITCPPTILTHYIAEHFHEILKYTKPQIADLLQKRKEVVNYIASLGLNCLEGETTFYLFLSIEGTCLSSEEFCRKLLNEFHICVVPGIGYGKSCDKYVRVSIGTESLERIFIALDKIKKLILDTSSNVINITHSQEPFASLA